MGVHARRVWSCFIWPKGCILDVTLKLAWAPLVWYRGITVIKFVTMGVVFFACG